MSDSTTPLLHILRKSDLNTLMRNGQKKLYPKNTIIVDEGDRPDCAYIINSGKVKIFLSDEHGREIVLSILKDGGYFGEMSLIDKEACSAAVMAMEDTELTAISRKNFWDCLHAHPEIAERIMLGLVTRLREANKKISSLALQDAHERVVDTLLGLAQEQDGQLIIENRPTHQHIANLVGTSREMITRILKDLTTAGHISIDGKRLVILNPGLK
jgi:CRP/FNR family cyclic AMP-dependent transcriptional regulator